MVTFYMDRVVLRVLFGFAVWMGCIVFCLVSLGYGVLWVFGWLRILVVLGFEFWVLGFEFWVLGFGF